MAAPVGAEGAPERSDEILPATRWVSLVVVAILIPAFVILWWLPGHTADDWAWTIRPDMTPIFMGAGYGAGAFFFWSAFRGRRWHEVAAGVLSASVFAGFMLLATLVHIDKFNQGDAPFVGAAVYYGWVAVYVVSPFLVGFLWLRNQRTDPRRPEPGEPVVPAIAVLAARAAAAGLALAGLVFFVAPTIAIDVWPWKLTPLTARVIASFTIQVGTGALLLSLDRRWSAWRTLLQTFLVASVLMLIGAARSWSEFDHANPLAWVFVAGLAGMAAAIGILYRRMAPPPTSPAPAV
ncbi:MAG: hypothetical protein QOE44_93 [Solirubrobacteraceae bacterium]|nr:hypothetical protein [Solirubrobacteraceae bacterium]